MECGPEVTEQTKEEGALGALLSSEVSGREAGVGTGWASGTQARPGQGGGPRRSRNMVLGAGCLPSYFCSNASFLKCYYVRRTSCWAMGEGGSGSERDAPTPDLGAQKDPSGGSEERREGRGIGQRQMAQSEGDTRAAQAWARRHERGRSAGIQNKCPLVLVVPGGAPHSAGASLTPGCFHLAFKGKFCFQKEKRLVRASAATQTAGPGSVWAQASGTDSRWEHGKQPFSQDMQGSQTCGSWAGRWWCTRSWGAGEKQRGRAVSDQAGGGSRRQPQRKCGPAPTTEEARRHPAAATRRKQSPLFSH